MPPAFTKIEGSDALICLAPATVTAADDEPELVMILAWADAPVKALQRYIKRYWMKWPGANIIILNIRQSYWLSSRAAKATMHRLIPVARKLEELAPKRVLIHSFSNGGCILILELSNALSIMNNSTPTPVPSSATIFDSGPGNRSWKAGSRAFSAHLANPVTRNITQAGIALYLGALYTWSFITSQPDAFDRMHDALLRNTTLNLTAPRTYIFSDDDEIIQGDVVREHARKAQAAGVPVELVQYEGTGHVRHASADPERYWAAVERTWKRGLAKL